MRQQGNCIVGDSRTLESYTATWLTVKMHPTSFYRHNDEIQSTLEKLKGPYVELDMGQYILLRFAEKDDVTTFHRNHHSYI